jgi:hypothetical protein
MHIEINHLNETAFAEIVAKEIVIKNTQDAIDIMANAGYRGANRIILYENQIVPEFFDLKTGIAGEILQKFSTYDVYLAIVGDFSKYTSKSLRDFIFESNKYKRVNFVNTRDEAIDRLCKK